MLIKVKVHPESGREEVVEKEPGTLEVWVKEKPVDNLANEAAKRAIARHLEIPEERVKLIRGFHERNKIFDIAINKTQEPR